MKKDFISTCYEAYDMLIVDGDRALESDNPMKIQHALERMLMLFLLSEEYERCDFLKRFARDKMGVDLKPDESIRDEIVSLIKKE